MVEEGLVQTSDKEVWTTVVNLIINKLYSFVVVLGLLDSGLGVGIGGGVGIGRGGMTCDILN